MCVAGIEMCCKYETHMILKSYYQNNANDLINNLMVSTAC
jgi:hypothetical protein